MLKDMPSASGKRTDLVASIDQVGKVTLKDIGITKDQSSNFQNIASIPEKQ